MTLPDEAGGAAGAQLEQNWEPWTQVILKQPRLVCGERWPSPRCKKDSNYCGEFGMCPETQLLLDDGPLVPTVEMEADE